MLINFQPVLQKSHMQNTHVHSIHANKRNYWQRSGSIVTKTLKNGILIPIITSKESHFHADLNI